MNNLSLKSFFDLYAVIPLFLLALSATFKFGYFNALDALWILPLLNVQGFIYSILITTMIFLLGTAVASMYGSLLILFGHIGLLFTFFVFPAICVFLAFDLDYLVTIVGKSVPYVLGFIYFFNFQNIFKEDEASKNFRLPTVLLFSFLGLFIMFNLGASKAYKDIGEKILPAVSFNEKNSASNQVKHDDWRLLESSGNNLILINLNNRNTIGRYELKVIEANKVDSIY